MITKQELEDAIATVELDPFDVGAAMAPAAVDTIATHLKDTGRSVDYYDLIVTGDLARWAVK
jgi:hypothetical protein